MPDFRKNVLFGQQGFDHSQFSGFGNGGFFAFVDYTLADPPVWPVQAPQAGFLKRTRSKLGGAEAVKLVGFGMNDHNTMGVPVPQFEQNLKEMVTRIRQETGAEVLLFSALGRPGRTFALQKTARLHPA